MSLDIENMTTLGLKDMHTLQVKSLLDFVNDAVTLAAMTGDAEIVDEIEQSADEMIRMFGGVGVTISVVDDR
jgi:hypothetical protein|tara:strand:+ start:237 stop:452 length:216 start_codon:yes stop_codon:yes gene_type:complete